MHSINGRPPFRPDRGFLFWRDPQDQPTRSNLNGGRPRGPVDPQANRTSQHRCHLGVDPLASSPERLRVLIAARNVSLIVFGACRTKCEAVTPAVKTDLALELYAR